MAEKSGFFNAREAEDGTYDREYDAEQFAEYFANFISNGVYANPANQLKVVFDDSPSKPFVVIVRKGKAYIDGYWYELTEDMEITIPANTKAYIVKDVIRCTLDKAERKVSIVLEEDVTSDHPTNNNNRHDLILSTIIVQPNASKLNAEDITDKRPDKTYCGFVTGVIDQIDTTELFQQYDETFQTWFNEMKGQLSTDAAGNLQTQIGLLSNLKTIVKDSIVNAINSLYDSTIGKTLKTLEEVSSNTEQGYYVDALAVAELNKNSYKYEEITQELPFSTSEQTYYLENYPDAKLVLINITTGTASLDRSFVLARYTDSGFYNNNGSGYSCSGSVNLEYDKTKNCAYIKYKMNSISGWTASAFKITRIVILK